MPQTRLINGINPLDHQGLVRKISWKHGRAIPAMREDFEQIGYIGLIKACERFDSSKGFAFSSFAWAYIEGEIAHWKRDKLSLVHISREELSRKLKAGETPYKSCELKPWHIIEDIDENRKALFFEVEKLTERQKTVIKMLFYEDFTMVQIAEKLGLSSQTVKRCRDKAIATLRSKFDSSKP